MGVCAMVAWSATLFEMTNECDRRIFYDLLNKTKSPHTYDYYQDEDMTLYIDNIRRFPNIGSLYEIQLDVLSQAFYVRDLDQPRQIRITARIALFIFEVPGWPSFLAVFASQPIVATLVRALHTVYAEEANIQNIKPILSRVLFSLREKESCLMKIFPDMKRIKVDKLGDMGLETATLVGHSLEEHPLYDQWVKSEVFGGQVQYFGLDVDGMTVVINVTGVMWSRQGYEKRPVRTVFKILNAIYECRAMTFQLTLTNPEYHQKEKS